jgi:Ca-activated chloride channel family protein
MMPFDAPLVLAAAPLVGLLTAVLALWARRARVGRAARWSPQLQREAQRIGRWSPAALGLVAAVATAALSGPRWGTRTVVTEAKGLNVVLAVDISRSMLAEDQAPSRLEHAKRQVRRLIYDLAGDRIGLVAFSGQSFILSPLTVDASALQLLVDALDPDLTSSGGTALTRPLAQARDLLFAGDPIADRVLVLFTDGEAHDSVSDAVAAAERLRRDGIRVVLVAQGGEEPTRIPVRGPEGSRIGWQRDPAGDVVETIRRDDVIDAVADGAYGVVVAAGHPDQAGAVRELVAGYQRSPQATSTAAQDVSRAWMVVAVACVLLALHTFTRRSMALASLLPFLLVAGADAQAPRNRGDDAWVAGAFRDAAAAYLTQLQAGEGGDTAWFNFGTAAMAAGDTAAARRALGYAAQSLDPDLRFQALYNLGLLRLRLARLDSAAARQHLEAARRHYREALLLRPGDGAAKWNLELAIRRMPPDAGGGGPPPPGQGGGGEPPPASPPRLTRAQAEQILNSMAEEERRTLLDRNERRRQGRVSRGRKEW